MWYTLIRVNRFALLIRWRWLLHGVGRNIDAKLLGYFIAEIAFFSHFDVVEVRVL